MNEEKNTLATVSLVCGIAGLLVWFVSCLLKVGGIIPIAGVILTIISVLVWVLALVLAIVALVTGVMGYRVSAQTGTGKGLAIAGAVIGGMQLIFDLLFIAFYLLVVFGVLAAVGISSL